MGSSDLGNYQLVRIIFIKVVSILLWPCKFNFFLRSWSSKFTDSVFFHFFGKQWYSYTIGGKKDSSKRYLWSKTTLITGGVGRTGADPLSWKTDTFLGPCLLVCQFIEISNQMEVNLIVNFYKLSCSEKLYLFYKREDPSHTACN